MFSRAVRALNSILYLYKKSIRASWYTVSMILGIDEVGRGSWAGPMVVGAVVLDPQKVAGLTDSKLLSAKQRERLAPLIKQEALAVGLGWVSARMIDRIGLAASLRLAAEKAVANIPE